MGSLIKYIPYPVVTGFTSGIAIIILSTQIRDFFGLNEKLPPDFIGKLRLLAENFQPNWATVIPRDAGDAGDLVLAEKNRAACAGLNRDCDFGHAGVGDVSLQQELRH